MSKKYVVTSAQYGADANKAFLKSLETYCHENSVDELIVLPMQGKYKDETNLDDLVEHYHVLMSEYKLNDNIEIQNYDIRPQQIDPITGLARIAQVDKSTIFPSPKQRLKCIPNSNYKLPKVLMTTGAITIPHYKNNRVGKIAKHDHKYGAIIVETLPKDKYHFRQIDATCDGVFADLGVMYNGKKIYQTRPEALVLGDWHTGDTDPKAKVASLDMIVRYKPKNIILHDFFNGHSINYHNIDNKVERAYEYGRGRLSLENELMLVSQELQEFVNLAPYDSKIIIVKSNHDEFLDKYLQMGMFINDPQNAKLGAKLFAKTVDGKDPLKAGIARHMRIPKNVIFLKRDEDYKIRGWQLGSHGDLGANGGRGSIGSKEYAYGKSITGHEHVPQILRNTYVVGTNSKLQLRYNRGLSAWMHTNALLYENGKVQLVNIINGDYRN